MKFYLFESAVGWISIIFSEEKIKGVQFAGASVTSGKKLIQKNWNAQENKKAPSWVNALAKKIKKHLAGDHQDFKNLPLDFEGVTPFRKKVYREAMKIKAGKVITYGELAEKCGSPKAARAVGSAMANNPFLILMPCHRVIGSTGKMHGFSAVGGIKTKEKLLEIEKSL